MFLNAFCRPLFLLIYEIIKEASAAQVFSTILQAATVIIQLAALLLTHQPSHYKPYRPRTKWRMQCGARWKAASARISSSANYAAGWVGATIETNLGEMRRARRMLCPSITRRHQHYYWTTYNYKRRHAMQVCWKCFWAVYSTTAARTAHSYQCCASTTVRDRAPAK